ncbi:Molybdopterin biosynthesis MoaE [Calocera cornea HHB12733]|uniref:Molybdopterin biosynthesis MoaE n=1 Tax=Calocera cornea HHB12733 TaxID=1353952 RepID=A0A165F0Y4_9BASI|nr:Molybdopterin biosynthesis MoaE [Calocera cornea HHB12733]
MATVAVTASFSSRLSTPDGDTCEITDKELVLDSVMQSIKHDGAGALVLFVGTTRDTFDGKDVVRLEYEAHTNLALRTICKIMQNIRKGHGSLIRLTCYHRIGNVPVGQPSIIVAASAPHRRASFNACEDLLEQVKEKAQIWKREWYVGEHEDEAQWKENANVSGEWGA